MQFCWQITIMLKKIMKKETQKSLFVKGVIVVLTACLMMIPILMVRLVVEDREDLSEKVRKEIADSWGYRQVLHAPALKVPYKDKRTYPDGGIYYEDSFCTNYSEVVTVESDVSVELLHRSIYDIPVYRADIKFSGTVIPDAELVEKARRYGGCWLYLDLSGLKGIEGDLDVEINGSRQGFTPSGTSLRTRIPAESMQESVPVDYSFSVRLKGSQSLNFSPDAGSFRLSMKSDWHSPGFNGAYLPSERNVNGEGFDAVWNISTLGLIDGRYESDVFGVDLVVPVSQYQQTVRAMKYAFLVIILVFMGIFLVEQVSRKSVSIVQYVVTGLSLSLFYLLLLSFTEYVQFGWAYLAAAVLTIVALCVYFRAILRSGIAYAFAGVVAVFYGFIYMLLKLETGSLLVGSVALFAILCVIMYFTRNSNKPEINGEGLS